MQQLSAKMVHSTHHRWVIHSSRKNQLLTKLFAFFNVAGYVTWADISSQLTIPLKSDLKIKSRNIRARSKNRYRNAEYFKMDCKCRKRSENLGKRHKKAGKYQYLKNVQLERIKKFQMCFSGMKKSICPHQRLNFPSQRRFLATVLPKPHPNRAKYFRITSVNNRIYAWDYSLEV